MPPVGTTINTLRWEGRVGRSHEGGSREWPPVYMTDDPLSWEGRLTALAGQPLFIDYYTLRVHTQLWAGWREQLPRVQCEYF